MPSRRWSSAFSLQSFNWRTVVFMNVLPGIAVAAFILVYVGRLQMADIRAGIAKAKPHAVGGVQRLRMLGTLVRNRALVTLSIGAAFRSMTQSALLTFLPLYLARVMGYPTSGIGACMFALAGRGFYRGAHRRLFLRHGRPPPDHHVEHSMTAS